MAGRCVIRCNVNNLLLAVVVIESAFLGVYFARALMSYPALGELPIAGSNGESAAVTVEPPSEGSEAWTATQLATNGFVGGLVFFIIQLLAILALLFGYKSQTWKPILVFFIWFLISTIIIVALEIYVLSDADNLWRQLTSADSSMAESEDLAPAYEYMKRIAYRLPCIAGPVLFIKLVLAVFEIIAVLVAVKYFRSLEPVPTAPPEENGKQEEAEMEEKKPLEEPEVEAAPEPVVEEQEKEKLVENA